MVFAPAVLRTSAKSSHALHRYPTLLLSTEQPSVEIHVTVISLGGLELPERDRRAKVDSRS